MNDMNYKEAYPAQIKLTIDEWRDEAIRRFGKSKLRNSPHAHNRFICPECGFVAYGRDWHERKLPMGVVCLDCGFDGAFSNPVEIDFLDQKARLFAFSDT